jgi:hypothetical protein
VIIDLEAYVRGLLLPVAFVLSLLARWFPALRFSWADYSRDPSQVRRHNSPWKMGMFIGIVTWLMFGLYGVLMLIHERWPSA